MRSMPDWKILITEGLDERGRALLHSGARVDDRCGISAEALLASIPTADALIVRKLGIDPKYSRMPLSRS